MDRRKTSQAAVGAAVAGGALAAAKLGWDRLSNGDDQRRFRLAEGESARDGIIRIACGQLDGAIEQLEGKGDADPATAVHEARKSFKRLRATARLARDELGDRVYRRENRAFRDAGLRLAGARDSQVMLDTFDALGETHPQFRQMLEDQVTAATQRLDDAAAGREEVLRELHDARARVLEWPFERDALEALAPGFRRIYRRGRRACRDASKDPTGENLHELRKRTKDVWYAAQIVRPASPKRMRRLARGAHALSDLIGHEHDLAVLAKRVEERRGDFSDEAAANGLIKKIDRRRKGLRKEALRTARSLYGKKPGKVVRPVEQSAML